MIMAYLDYPAILPYVLLLVTAAMIAGPMESNEEV
jgi:hypothetical protein